MASCNGAFTLPPEITLIVLSHLPLVDLPRLRRVCRATKDLVDSKDVLPLCRTGIARNIGHLPPPLLKDSTVGLLIDHAHVTRTCRWLASCVSDHLSSCLPAELRLPETDFDERVQSTLARDVWETHLFLDQVGSSMAKSTGESQGAARLCDVLSSAKKTLGLDTLDTVAKTFFLLADVMHEAIEPPANVSGTVLRSRGWDFSVSVDVFVQLLMNGGLRHANAVMSANDRKSQYDALLR